MDRWTCESNILPSPPPPISLLGVGYNKKKSNCTKHKFHDHTTQTNFMKYQSRWTLNCYSLELTVSHIDQKVPNATKRPQLQFHVLEVSVAKTSEKNKNLYMYGNKIGHTGLFWNKFRSKLRRQKWPLRVRNSTTAVPQHHPCCPKFLLA